MKRKLVVAAVLIAVLLGLFLYFFCNGLVLIDGKPALRVRLDISEDGEHILVPVAATLCKMGYEKISEEDGIIELQNGDQIVTLDLNAKTLIHPQSSINFIEHSPKTPHYFCERKDRDVFIDTGTFTIMLAHLDCRYQIVRADPQAKILKLVYNERLDYSQFLEKIYPETLPEEMPIEDQPDRVTRARLIVNGADITEGNYAYIHHGTQNAEIPVLAILRTLGYDARMQYNEKRDIYESVINSYHGSLSTEDEDFGILFRAGEKGCVRKIENNDFIVDYKCIRTQMYWVWFADITIDYLNSTIYVNPCDPWA